MRDDTQGIFNTIFSANPIDVYMGLGPVSKLLTSAALIVVVMTLMQRMQRGPRSGLPGTWGIALMGNAGARKA